MSQPMATGRWAATAVALVGLTAGCQSTGGNGDAPAGAPAPTATAAPTTAASPAVTSSPVTAANTVDVCQAVDRLIIAGSRKIAADSAAATNRELTPEQTADQLRRTLAGLADDVRAQSRRADDPRIRQLVGDTANRIDAGARAERPAVWLDRTFTGIPAALMRDCRP